jgi:hypothetical protein
MRPRRVRPRGPVPRGGVDRRANCRSYGFSRDESGCGAALDWSGAAGAGVFRVRARTSSLDALVSLIDWHAVAVLLDLPYPASKDEPVWPPLALFKALPLSIWYDHGSGGSRFLRSFRTGARW